MKCVLRWIAALLACLAASGPAGAADETAATKTRNLGADLFVAGGSVTVSEPVGGDLFVAGGSADVDGSVAGDVVAFGGKLRLGADVAQSVYAAGGQLNVNAKVGRNARVAGGQVQWGPKSELAGNLSVAGGQVRLHGTVRGHVQAAGGRVLIDGPVGGDVIATSGQVELGPNARIAGKLRYHSGDALKRDPAAQVTGVERLEPRWPGSEGASAPSDGREGATGGAGRTFGWVWTVGLMLLAAVLLALVPRYWVGVARTLRTRPWFSVLIGFVLLVCVPVAALILMASLIGIPVALATVALYLAWLPVAYVGAAIGLGDWALHRWQPAQAARLAWRIGAAAGALLLLALLGWLPWLGGLVLFAALLAGLGATALQALGSRSKAA